jgi:hypothetical protein
VDGVGAVRGRTKTFEEDISMSVQLTYVGEIEHDNAKGLLFQAAFTGNYGVNGVGDLLNLAPVELGVNPGGILDPKAKYNLILGAPPETIGVFSENIGGSYCQIKPNAVPTLFNYGLQMFEPGGAEKATGAAYTAAELAGNVQLVVMISSIGQ